MRIIKKIIIGCAIVFSLSVLAFAAEETVEAYKAWGWDFYPKYPIPNYGTGAHAELVKRGEYLVKVGDCISCHTNTLEGGKPFAGGFGLRTPFGIFYSPNITADKETGIGNWTDKDFIRAMHEGLDPQGRNYFPVFPYTSFTKVSDQDILAIKAYLFSLPTVHQENKETTAIWPFSWRFAQWGWKILFFDRGYYQYDPNQTPQWNRGAYLVQGLGHCGECHTPRNFLGAMKTKYYLTGAIIDGFWCPDITHAAFKNVTVDDIMDVFNQSQLVQDAGPVRGPMAEVSHNSLQHLSLDDQNAIAVYLKSVKSIQPRFPKGVPGTPNLKLGKKVYNKVCAICHDNGVAGAPKIFDTANWQYRLKQGVEVLYTHAIKGYNNMPLRGGCVTCSDDDVKAAVNYILINSQDPSALNRIRAQESKVNTSISYGKDIYEKHCALCHKDGKYDAPVLGDQKAWKPLVDKGMEILILNTINGVGNMPKNGGCTTCTRSDVIAAVKYMAQQGDPEADYSLW